MFEIFINFHCQCQCQCQCLSLIWDRVYELYSEVEVLIGPWLYTRARLFSIEIKIFRSKMHFLNNNIDFDKKTCDICELYLRNNCSARWGTNVWLYKSYQLNDMLSTYVCFKKCIEAIKMNKSVASLSTLQINHL